LEKEKKLFCLPAQIESFGFIVWTSTQNWVRRSTAVDIAVQSAVQQCKPSQWTCSSGTSKGLRMFLM